MHKRFGSSSMLALISALVLIAGLTSSAAADSAAIWTEIYPTGSIPDGSFGFADAYDPHSDRVILFNRWTAASTPYPNNNDVWLLENATGSTGAPEWVNLIPSSQPGSPQSRHGHGSIYDPISNRLMLFGGCGGGCYPTLGDMWVLTNANGTEATPPQWTRLYPTGTSPYPRNAPRLSYDPGSNRMIMFSGQTGSGYGGAVYNDVWVLTNANGLGGTPEWIKLVSSMPTMGQYYAGTGYDQASNRLIIFGGVNQNNQWTNGVWILINANGLGGPSQLLNLIPDGSATAPPAEFGSTMYIPARNQLMFFGSDGSPWILDNANGLGGSPVWTQLASSGSTPSSPRGPACCYDPPQHRMLLLEGISMADAWWLSLNNPPTANAGGPYSGNEGDTVPLDGSASNDPDNDIATYEWDLDNDGEFDDATGMTTDASFGDDGVYIVGLRVTDESGEWDTDTGEVSVDNVPPNIEALVVPVDPMQVGSEIEASATFTDPGALDTHTATWNWGDDSSDGLVDGYSVSGSHIYDTPGLYTVTLTVEDDDFGYDTDTFQYAVIYDPEGGFVTGGGWIYSEPGAYVPDPSLEGKATFGFISKYKKGATLPTGTTEFQFKTADLNFHSDSYQWLVVTGSDYAKFKGVGTINGAGEYKFQIWAGDGDPDTFRIKIWTEDETTGVETVVYDNGFDQALGGGSIIVHTKK